MTIDERLHPRIGEGVYAHVFKVDDLAYKLFVRYPQFPPRQTEEGRRLTFKRQCHCYDLVGSCPFLNRHVPRFYGTCTISEILDVNGLNVGDRYLLDWCYMTEVLCGNEQKFLSPKLRDDYPYLRLAQT